MVVRTALRKYQRGVTVAALMWAASFLLLLLETATPGLSVIAVWCLYLAAASAITTCGVLLYGATERVVTLLNPFAHRPPLRVVLQEEARTRQN